MAKTAMTKRLMIDKANSNVVIVTAVAAFVVVFSLIASKTLFSQAAYQNRVIGKKHAAVARLKDNIKETAQLKTAYDAFTSTPQNAIGGNPDGSGPQDGNNAKIVLDALPSSYDFPALATSIESLITSNAGLTIDSITGTDDEVNQSSNQTSSNPTTVAIPFQLSVEGNYQSIQDLIGKFEHSIRPFQMQTIDLSGTQDDLTLNLTAQTFYQPAKVLNLKNTVVVK